MLLLADEPTGNLDADIADETMRLFLKIRDQGATLIVASHDFGIYQPLWHANPLLRTGRLGR